MEDIGGGFVFPAVDLSSDPPPSRDEVIGLLVGRLIELGRLRPEDRADVIAHVLAREVVCSTGLGGGGAVPHCRSRAVNQVAGVVGRIPSGVAWAGAVDG